MMRPNENFELLQGIISDEESALNIIYKRYSKRVYNLSLYLLKDTGWSEDIVQEVFIKFWNSRKRLDPNGDIWTLLYVITKRTSLNKLRDVGKSKPGIEKVWANISNTSETVYEVFLAKELSSQLGALLEHLPARQKEIFCLTRDHGFTYKQIANQLGVSPNTVRNHLVQTLKRIRKYI